MRMPLNMLLILFALWPFAARAQLAECPGIGANEHTYKVVLDELHFATPAASSSAALGNLRELLIFNLTTQLAEFEADLKTRQGDVSVALGLVTCKNRRPSLDGSEFSRERAETLSDMRVVLELWGTLAEDPAVGSADSPHAIIGYVVPPLLHFRPASAPSGKQLVRYPKPGAADPAESLRKLPEASALALMGLAIKAQKARKYDVAVWAFNLSESQFRDTGLSGGFPAADGMLAYVRKASCETRELARADTTYTGALRLLPAESCEVTP